MKKEQWSPYEEEEFRDGDGALVSKKTTFKKNTKVTTTPNYFDLILKSIGVLAIFIPILLIYLQRKNSISLEKNKQLSESFISFSRKTRIIDNYLKEDSLSLSPLFDSLEIEFPTKFLIFGNLKISAKAEEILELQKLHSLLAKLNRFINERVSLILQGVSLAKVSTGGASYQYKADSTIFFRAVNGPVNDSNLIKLNKAYDQIPIISETLRNLDSLNYARLILKSDSTRKLCDCLIVFTTKESASSFKQNTQASPQITSCLDYMSMATGRNQFIRDSLIPYIKLLKTSKKKEFINLVYAKLDG